MFGETVRAKRFRIECGGELIAHRVEHIHDARGIPGGNYTLFGASIFHVNGGDPRSEEVPLDDVGVANIVRK